jgi:hypothetical protein
VTPAELYAALTAQWEYGTADELLIQTTGQPLDLDGCRRAQTLAEYLALVFERTGDPHTAMLVTDLVARRSDRHPRPRQPRPCGRGSWRRRTSSLAAARSSRSALHS